MLRVWSDMLKAADSRQVTLLCLLDLSAAFDCVDHDLLLQRLQLSFSLTGVAFEWIRSFLTGRTQQIAYQGQLSTCGVRTKPPTTKPPTTKPPPTKPLRQKPR